jgi:hypothetical protein
MTPRLIQLLRTIDLPYLILGTLALVSIVVRTILMF